MGRYLFVCHDAGGTIAPVLAVSAELVERGHEVAVLSQPSVEQRARGVGCSFYRFSETPDYRRDVSLEQQLDLTVPALIGAATGRDLLAVSGDFDPDILVIDPNLAGALAAAETLTTPTAVLLHSMYKTFVDVWFGELWALLAEPINATRTQLDATAATSWADMLRRHDLILSPVPPVFDAPVDNAPTVLQHVGFVVPTARGHHGPPRQRPGDDPIVAVSLSTTFHNQAAALGAVLGALADEPVRVVATTAGYAPTSQPPNAVVADWIPHQQLFGLVDAVVTHGGLGTISAALDAGVPLVCVPGERDQPLNASRVSDLGAGITCSEGAVATDLCDAVRDLLRNPDYCSSASAIADASRRSGGAQTAATLLETLAT